ncbi:unnamed protein product, partial [Medioppia subpectinata]
TNGTESRTLRQVQLPIVDNGLCSLKWGASFRPATQLCAGYLFGGEDFCQGDSGGPFNCQLANGAYIAQGIVSFTDARGCGLAFSPSVFTRVEPYIPWIESVTGLKF